MQGKRGAFAYRLIEKKIIWVVWMGGGFKMQSVLCGL